MTDNTHNIEAMKNIAQSMIASSNNVPSTIQEVNNGFGDGGDSSFLDTRQRIRSYSSEEKAAMVLYILGPNRAEELFEKLDEKDHRAFAKALHQLGYVTPEKVEEILNEFLHSLKGDGPIRGGSNEARRFLSQVLPKDMVERIMEEIEGRFDTNIWDRVSTAPETTLASYLRGEQIQTVAVILSRIRSEKAAKILDLFPVEKAKRIVAQMSRLGSIDLSVLNEVQHALRDDFLAMLMKQSASRKPTDIIASIMNSIPGTKAQSLVDYLREVDEYAGDVVQKSMFTFDDFPVRINPLDLQKVIKEVEGGVLVRALKMAKQKQPKTYDYFIGNMSKRAAEMIDEEIENYGPLRLKDAEQAQTDIIQITRDLARIGAIEISEADTDTETEGLI
jgi:flagellar motor switch protein FliG